MRDGIERTAGFTLVELIVIIVILVAMTAVTVPGIRRWLPNYNLKRASMDLYSSMQLAKSEAIRNNRPYAVLFDPGSETYQFIDSGPDGIYEYPDVAADDIAGETISISKYGPAIAYGHTPATKNFDDGGSTFPGDEVSYTGPGNVVLFDGRGLCNSGSVYLQNNNSRTYAIGTLMSGAVRIKMWRGSKWE
jgi:type II secretion system protein H